MELNYKFELLQNIKYNPYKDGKVVLTKECVESNIYGRLNGKAQFDGNNNWYLIEITSNNLKYESFLIHDMFIFTSDTVEMILSENYNDVELVANISDYYGKILLWFHERRLCDAKG